MSELQQICPQEMKEFANEFREVIVAAPFQVPEDLVLLGRTVAILSGMCTGLNPQFNVWQGIAPFAEELLEEDGIGDWRFWAEELATFILALLSLPMRTRAVLGKIEHGELQVRVPRLEAQVSRLDLTIRRLTATIVFAGLLFSGVQLYLGGEKIFASGLFAIAGIALIWLVVARR